MPELLPKDAAPEAASRTEAPQEAQPSAGLTLAEEAQLPGAEENPCCMGTAASEMLAVIQSFIDAELLNQRYDQALARQAPSWARGRMRELAAAAGARARRLMAVYYLITGSCYQPVVESGRCGSDERNGAGRLPRLVLCVIIA